MFDNIHKQAIKQLDWYNKLHHWKYYQHFHITILVLYLIFALSLGLSAFTNPPKARATDPEITTVLLSGTMGLAPGGSAIYDMVNHYKVTSISATVANGCPGCQYTFYVSYDSINWGSPAATINATSGGIQTTAVDGSGRYVKWAVDPGSRPTFRLSDLHIYGRLGPTELITSGCTFPLTASITQPPNAAADTEVAVCDFGQVYFRPSYSIQAYCPDADPELALSLDSSIDNLTWTEVLRRGRWCTPYNPVLIGDFVSDARYARWTAYASDSTHTLVGTYNVILSNPHFYSVSLASPPPENCSVASAAGNQLINPIANIPQNYISVNEWLDNHKVTKKIVANLLPSLAKNSP